MIRKLTEDQTLYLLKTQGNNRPVQLAFGPSGVWLRDVPENAWAFEALRLAAIDAPDSKP